VIEKPNKANWLVFASVLVGHLLLVSLPADSPAHSGFVRSLIMDFLTPAERLVNRSVSGLGGVWTNYFALLETREENLRLQAEVDRLRMEMQLNREAVLEAARLRRFLELDLPAGSEGVVARVTGGDPSVSQRTVMLDKGRGAGIEPGSPVITPDGIVGRVIYTSHFSSIVQLVTDPTSAVGALVQTSRVQGIIRGNGTRELVFEHSEDGTDLLPGDILVTSGTERIYPKGLPVGVIASVGSVTDLVSTALVEPSADLGKLEEIMVLGVSTRSLPEPEEIPEPADEPEP